MTQKQWLNALQLLMYSHLKQHPQLFLECDVNDQGLFNEVLTCVVLR